MPLASGIENVKRRQMKRCVVERARLTCQGSYGSDNAGMHLLSVLRPGPDDYLAEHYL
jgi:hypothetical protein